MSFHKRDSIHTDEECHATLSEEDNELLQSFSVSESEFEAVNAWQKEHDMAVHSEDGSGRYGRRFLPTAAGTIGYCICTKCRSHGLDYGSDDGFFNLMSYRTYMSDMKGMFVFRDVHE